MKLTKIILIFGASILLSLQVHTLKASTREDRADRLFERLQHIPFYSAPYSRVEMIVANLAELNPRKAYLYFKIGFSRLKSAGLGKKKRLGNVVINRVYHSNLPLEQRIRIEKRVYRAANKINDTFE